MEILRLRACHVSLLELLMYCSIYVRACVRVCVSLCVCRLKPSRWFWMWVPSVIENIYRRSFKRIMFARRLVMYNASNQSQRFVVVIWSRNSQRTWVARHNWIVERAFSSSFSHSSPIMVVGFTDFPRMAFFNPF